MHTALCVCVSGAQLVYCLVLYCNIAVIRMLLAEYSVLATVIR